jgi:hypothetical protein
MNKNIMEGFIGKVIKVDRGGPESKIGMLMDASDDLMVLLTEDDGVVYYNAHHIKSFTDEIKEQMEFNLEVPKDFEFKKAANFFDILDSLKSKWIKINRGGPEQFEGIVLEVNKDFVCLINNEEIVRLSLFHIKSMSYGLKIEKAEEEKSDEQQSRQKGGKSNDNSQNKKNRTKTSKRGTSQKTNGNDAEIALAYPLSTMDSSPETVVEDAVSNLAIPLSTKETSQETAVGDAESDLSVLLSTKVPQQKTAFEDAENDLSIFLSIMENFLQIYSKAKQN